MNTLIGQKIKTLRKQKGLSQEQVADSLHISQPTYARIERGEGCAWASYLEPISKFFDIKPEELLMQDKVIVNNNQQGGNGAFIIHQELAQDMLNKYEKIIDELKVQYEKRLKDKDEIITMLKQQLNRN